MNIKYDKQIILGTVSSKLIEIVMEMSTANLTLQCKAFNFSNNKLKDRIIKTSKSKINR